MAMYLGSNKVEIGISSNLSDFNVATVTLISNTEDANYAGIFTRWDEDLNINYITGVCKLDNDHYSIEPYWESDGHLNITTNFIFFGESIEIEAYNASEMTGNGNVTYQYYEYGDPPSWIATITGDCIITIS